MYGCMRKKERCNIVTKIWRVSFSYIHCAPTRFFLSLSFLALTCLYALVARAKHSCSLCLILFWSLPYHILSTHRSLIFFFSFLSILLLILPLTLSFVYSSDNTLKKKRAKKKRTDKLK